MSTKKQKKTLAKLLEAIGIFDFWTLNNKHKISYKI